MKTTLIFVHGTGVRGTAYASTLNMIQENVIDRSWSVDVRGCYWGGSEGARLNLGGRSIPSYVTTGGKDPSDEEILLALWSVLYTDPWYELRVLRNMPKGPVMFGEEPASVLIRQNMEHFIVSDQLRVMLSSVNLEAHFHSAVDALLRAPEFAEAIASAPPNPLEHRRAIARALIAHALVSAKQAQAPPIHGDARDDLVDRLSNDLHGYGLGIGEFLLRPAKELAVHVGARIAESHRGRWTDATAPMAGDVLRYLANRKSINSFLRDTISDSATGPIVLLGHSLGGIMCVNLLIEDQYPQVSALVTVGSQAPLLYEIGALPGLEPPLPLPNHFPNWTNIYDRSDLLAYVGNDVFHGKVSDIEVNNREPFPETHSAYWSNPDVWRAIEQVLP